MGAIVAKRGMSVVAVRCTCGMKWRLLPLHDAEGNVVEHICECCVFEGLDKGGVRLQLIQPRPWRKPARRAR